MQKKKLGTLLVGGVVACGLVAAMGLAGCSGSSSSSSSSDNSSSSSSSSSSTSSTSSSSSAVELQVYAANSLQKALPEVQDLYTQANSNVTFKDTQFEASGTLVKKIQEGADVDVLITASKGSMDDAADYITTDTRKNMFTNDLIIVKKAGTDVTINSIADVANVNGKIAIGEASSVPAGKYANQALASVGLYTGGTDGEGGTYDASIADKMDLCDKVGTVAQHVASGDAVVGFIYTSDLYRYDGIETAFTCPADSHKTIQYPGAVLKNSANAEESQKFLEFCTTDPGAQEVFSKYGFQLATE